MLPEHLGHTRGSTSMAFSLLPLKNLSRNISGNFVLLFIYEYRNLLSSLKNIHDIVTGMKQKPSKSEFGKRLASLRKAKGLTQAQLGDLVGVSNRVIAYYEKETQYPPSRLIVPLAKALEVSADELLGMKEAKTDFDSSKAALWRKLKVVGSLPQIDQKAILHYIRTLAKNRDIDQKAVG